MAEPIKQIVPALQMPQANVQKGSGSPIKPGWAGGPGRPKGVPNRVKADLAQLIMDAAGEVGFIKRNKHGKPTATGIDGCKGYLRWLALNHPQTYAALMARVLPYYVNTELPEEILTRDETIAQLKERGLPIELLQHLQKATQPLDDDEETDPYRSPDDAIDVTPKKESSE